MDQNLADPAVLLQVVLSALTGNNAVRRARPSPSCRIVRSARHPARHSGHRRDFTVIARY
jgi:hypothetical protein